MLRDERDERGKRGKAGERVMGVGDYLMGRRAMGALVLTLAILSAGCGSRVARVSENVPAALSDATEVSSDDALDGGLPTPDANATDGPTPTSGSSDSPGEPTPSKSPDFGPKHNNGVIRVTLSSRCVTRGTLMLATLKGPPKAGIGAIVGYSDNQPHGAMITGETNDAGIFEWRFPVAPTAPLGEAKLLATATGANWDNEGGGTTDEVFRVVDRLEDC